MADRAVSGAVPNRHQDQPVRYRPRDPALYPNLDFSQGWAGIKDFLSQLDLDNFKFLTTDDLYWKAYLSSLRIALLSTFLTLCVAYPLAYGMARAPDEWRPTLMMLVILPFWSSFLIRVYSWKAILANEGLLNQFLMLIRVIDEPLTILNTPTAVYIGIVYTYLPFMVLPLYSALEKLDGSLLEAAEDMAAPGFRPSGSSPSRCRATGSSRAVSSSSSRSWANS